MTDSKKRSLIPFWLTATIAATTVLYVLSSGPVVWLSCKGYLPGWAFKIVYAPLEWLVVKSPEPLLKASSAWYRFWAPNDWEQEQNDKVGEAIAEQLFKEMGVAFANEVRNREAPGSATLGGTDDEQTDSQDPKDADSYCARGVARCASGKFDDAIADFNEAIRLAPTVARNWYNRGSTFSDMGQFERALADLDEAIRLNPIHVNAYVNRGNAWFRSGQSDRAIADFSEAVRLDPNFANAFRNRGTAWDSKGYSDKAAADFEEAIRLNPKDALGNNLYAWLLSACPDATCRDGKRAVRLATTACELSDWKKADDIDTLAAAYAEAGDFESAVTWQENALDLAPEAEKDDFRSRLGLYKSGKPFRDDPKK
jgi:tetratricopeptide (TPR) repeat protein